MDDVHAEGGEDVRDDPPVASPPEKLGAHDRGAEPVRERQELLEPDGKLLTRDMIGIRAERGMAPRQVDRQWVWAPAPAELGDPLIQNALVREISFECVRRELRE